MNKSRNNPLLATHWVTWGLIVPQVLQWQPFNWFIQGITFIQTISNERLAGAGETSGRNRWQVHVPTGPSPLSTFKVPRFTHNKSPFNGQQRKYQHWPHCHYAKRIQSKRVSPLSIEPIQIIGINMIITSNSQNGLPSIQTIFFFKSQPQGWRQWRGACRSPFIHDVRSDPFDSGGEKSKARNTHTKKNSSGAGAGWKDPPTV